MVTEEAIKIINENIILPKGFKVGHRVYAIDDSLNNKGQISSEIILGYIISVTKQAKFDNSFKPTTTDKSTIWIYVRFKNGLTYHYLLNDLNNNLFATRKEAIDKLKSIQA